MNRRKFGAGPVPFLLFALFAVAVMSLLASQPALAARASECVSVQIDGPFRLPDGVLREAGELTLCDTREFSPVAHLHAILVNGATVGVFQSRRRSTETGPVDSPQVVFDREADGTLALLGYIVPASGRSLAFRLKGESETWQVARRTREGGGSAPVAAIIAATAMH